MKRSKINMELKQVSLEHGYDPGTRIDTTNGDREIDIDMKP